MKNKFFLTKTNDRVLFQSEHHVNVECIPHLHVTMEIVIVTKGMLHMNVSGREYDIGEGFGMFVPPFEIHSFHSEHPNKCHVLEFSRDIVRYFYELTKDQVPSTNLFRVSKEGMDLCARLFFKNHEEADPVRACAALSPLCYDVFCQCAFKKRDQILDDVVERVLEFINEHFYEEISLAAIAKEVGVHPVTLSKMFLSQTGIGIWRYLQYVRCNHASKLIKMTNKSFTEIAYESGFGSIRSFNRNFLSQYGESPTEHKQKSLLGE